MDDALWRVMKFKPKFQWDSPARGKLLTLYDMSARDATKKSTVEKKRHLKIKYGNAKVLVNFCMNNAYQTFVNELGIGVGSKDVEEAANQNHGHKFNRFMSNTVECCNINKLFAHAQNAQKPLLIVDVGAAYGRYSSYLKSIFTP